MGAEKRGQTGQPDRPRKPARKPSAPPGAPPEQAEQAEPPAKTIHFISLGCPKNRVDSEVMLGVARGAGYAHVDAAEDTEVIVVNTCGFIGEAKKESIDSILEMAALKDKGSLR